MSNVKIGVLNIVDSESTTYDSVLAKFDDYLFVRIQSDNLSELVPDAPVYDKEHWEKEGAGFLEALHNL